MGLGDLNRIENAFADAALDPALWTHALEVASQETGSWGATLLPLSGHALPNVPASQATGEVLEHYFRDGWHLRDQRHAGIPLLMRAGAVDDTDFVDPEVMKRHPYYQEFLAPHGLQWFVGVKVACKDEIWCLSIQRRIEQGPLPREEKPRLALLSRSLSTSAALARALAASTVNGALPSRVLEAPSRAIGMGIFFTVHYGTMLLFPVVQGALARSSQTASVTFDAAAILLLTTVPLLIAFDALARSANRTNNADQAGNAPTRA
jgi:hypothetical protein